MSKDKENTSEKDLEVNDSNIFEEFDSDKDLKSDISNYKVEEGKDIYYYIEVVGGIFKYINLFLLLLLIILFAYIFVQKNENFSNSPILDPICFILSGDNAISTDYCSSISFLSKDYNSKLAKLQKKQFDSIIDILPTLYTVNNFMNSRDVAFLLDKSFSRLKPIEILNEFDNLKNEFEPIDKSKITCFDIEIRNSNILTAKCEVFSTHWEKLLVNFEGEISRNSSVSGTSVSIASSFLNFIEKKSDKFTIINKQKEFSFENIIGENEGYVKKTSFHIKLKYNTSNLSL